jgi:hypothetical protein
MARRVPSICCSKLIPGTSLGGMGFPLPLLTPHRDWDDNQIVWCVGVVISIQHTVSNNMSYRNTGAAHALA